MDDMQSQMNAILNNPEMMQKIMAMAQSMNTQPPRPETESAPPSPPSAPEFDPSLLQKLAGLTGQSGIDSNQKTLLKALTPYLSRERISKLERAMRAAKIANMASSFLGQSGLPFLTGR